MIWHSGWKLASAVSNCGGLALSEQEVCIPDILRENIQMQTGNDKPWRECSYAVSNLEEIIQIILEEGVKIVFTSAGNPKTYTETLTERRNKSSSCSFFYQICCKM
jgi:enoyl-[acyl-carrier protein] reductase II